MIPRNFVTSIPECPSFRTPFQSQSVHRTQTLLKPAHQHFYLNFPLIYIKLNWQASVLVRCVILRLFGNTLTEDNIYFRHRWERFTQQVQTLLSQKQKTVSQYFIAFLQSTRNSTFFEKKDQLPTLNISEVIDSEKCPYFNSPTPHF